MTLESIGLGWSYPVSWIIGGGLIYGVLLLWHARNLFKKTTRSEAIKLSVLRGISGLFLLLLIARPFIEQSQTNPDAVRLVSLIDLSGSMNEQDNEDGKRRIDQVRELLDINRADSWINLIRSRYGSVDRLGFSDHDVYAIRSSSWAEPDEGKSTSLGNALIDVLESEESVNLGAVVLFSDGRNNTGKSPLEAGEKFRERAIPVNVIGVGQVREHGNLSVAFADVPSESVAKEELIFSAEIKNGFAKDKSTTVRLFNNDVELETRNLSLGAGESRIIRFSPHIPEIAGIRTYRVLVDPLEGDADPSDDVDVHVMQILPPQFFSSLYISHQIRPIYPFLKRALAQDRFQLSSLIRLGEQTFHALGDNVLPHGYPENPEFWMDYDVIMLDCGSLRELNASMIGSLKDFVQKRGGGLLLFGDPEPAQELLGGLMPALETQSAMAKEDLSLSILPDPLFTERKRLDQWKTFLPGGMPAELVTRINPAARDVVRLKGGSNQSILTIQAYGAGKSAYWGSPHDWKRSLINEDRSLEFSFFWSGVIEWLGSGTVNRIKVDQQEEPRSAGEENILSIDVLGQDFEPSMDAQVEANVTGPDGYVKSLQLYPQGGSLGRYTGKFKPPVAGSFRVLYHISFPNGEKLKHLSYVKIKQHGDETKDTRYAERELQMLANLTGGEFIIIENIQDEWIPRLSSSLPTITKRTNLADAWMIFLIIFFAAGMEWIMRRKAGLK